MGPAAFVGGFFFTRGLINVIGSYHPRITPQQSSEIFYRGIMYATAGFGLIFLKSSIAFFCRPTTAAFLTGVGVANLHNRVSLLLITAGIASTVAQVVFFNQ